MHQWDLFISHASEDKDGFVRELAGELQERGFRVWYDEEILQIGDSIRRTIERGLAGSRYGVVVISPSFLDKEWPQKELDYLIGTESDNEPRILPLWYNLDRQAVLRKAPLLADRYAIRTDSGVKYIARKIEEKIGRRLLDLAMPIGRNQVVGRERDRTELVRQLSEVAGSVAITGWPGVGKTTLARLLLSDSDLRDRYPDGQVWLELQTDTSPETSLMRLRAELQLGMGSNNAERLERLVDELGRFLSQRRVLLVIDDVWTVDQADAISRVLGNSVGLVLTTRILSVASRICPSPYVLRELAPEEGVRLMAAIAPDVASRFPAELADLAVHLEGLPIALNVAARLLGEEYRRGLPLQALFDDLRDCHRVLAERAPADRFDPLLGTTPTVRLLFEKSTRLLDSDSRERFALLGEWANPAVFDTQALAQLWDTYDPNPTLRRLADLGLVEPIGDGWFGMHALIVAHASSLLH